MTTSLARSPSRLARRLKTVVLVVSLLANIGFVARIVVFDPIWPFRPRCIVANHGPTISLQEPLSNAFAHQMHIRLSGSRLTWAKGELTPRLYVPLWWYWRESETDTLANATHRAVEHLYEKKMLGGRKLTFEEAGKLFVHRCKFIRKWALRDPT